MDDLAATSQLAALNFANWLNPERLWPYAGAIALFILYSVLFLAIRKAAMWSLARLGFPYATFPASLDLHPQDVYTN